MLDHDTDSYYKISRAFVAGEPSGNLTRDHILDNITLYWLTGTGVSAARSYWEGRQAGLRAAGWRSPTPASSTSTKPTRVVTSPPGKSRSSSRPRCAPRSDHSGER